MSESYYQYHLFFCTNLRENGLPCCARFDAQKARDYAKKQLKNLASVFPNKIRVNSAGCLDRCANGPVLVIYPEGIWYTYKKLEDIDEIINEHLIKGHVVERLEI